MVVADRPNAGFCRRLGANARGRRTAEDAIGRPVVVAGGATYAVHVLAAGTPIFVIAPKSTHSAYLEVNGSVVESGGAASPIG